MNIYMSVCIVSTCVCDKIKKMSCCIVCRNVICEYICTQLMKCKLVPHVCLRELRKIIISLSVSLRYSHWHVWTYQSSHAIMCRWDFPWDNIFSFDHCQRHCYYNQYETRYFLSSCNTEVNYQINHVIVSLII